MKRTQEQPLDTTQDVALTVHLPFQKKPFVINGTYDSVMPIAEAVQAADRAEPVQRSTVSTKVAQTALETVREPYLEGRRATIAAKLYDLRNGRNMYELLKQKREQERDLQFAAKLGLLSVEDLYCARHRKAVDKLAGLAVE